MLFGFFLFGWLVGWVVWVCSFFLLVGRGGWLGCLGLFGFFFLVGEVGLREVGISRYVIVVIDNIISLGYYTRNSLFGISTQ